MTCAICGVTVRVERHRYFEGVPERPVRQWHIDAPRYFKPTPDRLGCEAPFCGPACATSHHQTALRGAV